MASDPIDYEPKPPVATQPRRWRQNVLLTLYLVAILILAAAACFFGVPGI